MNEWISVKDRLPEKDVDVLVFAVGKLDGFIGQTSIRISSYGEVSPLPRALSMIDWREPNQYFLTDYKITHWMPLPESPKEEK